MVINILVVEVIRPKHPVPEVDTRPYKGGELERESGFADGIDEWQLAMHAFLFKFQKPHSLYDNSSQ